MTALLIISIPFGIILFLAYMSTPPPPPPPKKIRATLPLVSS